MSDIDISKSLNEITKKSKKKTSFQESVTEILALFFQIHESNHFSASWPLYIQTLQGIETTLKARYTQVEFWERAAESFQVICSALEASDHSTEATEVRTLLDQCQTEISYLKGETKPMPVAPPSPTPPAPPMSFEAFLEDFFAPTVTGASRDAKNNLLLRTINAKDVADDLSCCICLEKFPLQMKVKTLPCCHVYHDECIEEWLKKSTACPACRNALPEEKNDDKYLLLAEAIQKKTAHKKMYS